MSQAELTLSNLVDGSAHTFVLHGTGLKPVSLGLIKLSCQIGGCNPERGDRGDLMDQAEQFHPFTIPVPNHTSKKQCYRLETDQLADHISWSSPTRPHAELFEVLPGRTDECQLYFRVTRRGLFKGILAFVSGDPESISSTDVSSSSESPQSASISVVEHAGIQPTTQQASDLAKLNAEKTNQMDSIYRVWYELEMFVKPGQSVKK
ncbi:unnamed protein product [Echinostoma caproni]|uniref:Laminin IV type A domain-containing protein n=1 Tax=Echinostoma caproni TaxID=27848 RepID=A0A183BAK6_9TREM|nr:unnamed protein product [Echinostoma caproni]